MNGRTDESRLAFILKPGILLCRASRKCINLNWLLKKAIPQAGLSEHDFQD
jgi:hypothetical protein